MESGFKFTVDGFKAEVIAEIKFNTPKWKELANAEKLRSGLTPKQIAKEYGYRYKPPFWEVEVDGDSWIMTEDEINDPAKKLKV